MFNNSKYTKWYYNIVNNALNRNKELDYYEEHHILPKSMGGSNTKINLVKLTAKEHYIVHLLLMKMCINRIDRQKMASAFLYMSKGKNKNTIKRYNSKLYEYHKKIRSKILSEQMSGENNPMYGKKHTKETLNKISKANSLCRLTNEGRFKKSEYTKNNNPMNNPLYAEKARINRAKTYKIYDPLGREIIIKNLAEFCRNNNLCKSSMCAVSKGKRKSYKGWKCILV